MDKAIALVSGGLDSSVAAWLARENGLEVKTLLTFNYGQRAALREIESANRLSEWMKAEHVVLSLPFFSEYRHGNSLLSKEESLPSPTADDLNDPNFSQMSAAAVWVPNRNGILIEIAAGIAEDRGYQAVIVGFNVEEAATFPDNSKKYLKAVNESLAFSTNGRVRVLSPTIDMDKKQIVDSVAKSDFPLHIIWSCYESKSKMCGACESCMRLKRALTANEVSLDRFFSHASV